METNHGETGQKTVWLHRLTIVTDAKNEKQGKYMTGNFTGICLTHTTQFRPSWGY
jgi:hypothetical protein